MNVMLPRRPRHHSPRRLPPTVAGFALATACAILLASPATAAAPANGGVLLRADPVPAIRILPVSGMGVPWAVGLKWPDGEIAAEWPPFDVPSLRLWDTRTSWAEIERTPGHRDFSRLDEFVDVAESKGTTDLLMVLAGTPTWAATRSLPSDAPWIGPGSASPPADLAAWEDFVTATARRYAGRIQTYEIGNEPNLLTFWNGTPVEYESLVTTAAKAIHAADPSARVLANLGVARRTSDIKSAASLARLLKSSPYIDGFAVHLYPSVRNLSREEPLLVGLRRALHAVDPRRPLWLTEVNVVDGASLPPMVQEIVVMLMTQQALRAHYQRVYWYAWTRHGPEDLIQLWPGSPGADGFSDFRLAS